MNVSGSAETIAELTRSSSFVFSGTVVEVGASNVRVLEPQPNFMLVRVHRGLRVDPALGDVRGRVVTVETATPHELSPGTQALFFTQSWIHGHELAVREVAHVDVALEDEVAAAVERLPDLYLIERLTDAVAVVHAEVQRTRRIANTSAERRAPRWAQAHLHVISTLKGDASDLRLLFPTSESHHWYRAPRLRRGQRAVFVLHADESHAARWLDQAAEHSDVVTALDPADVQPESQVAHIRALLRSSKA